MPPRSNNPKGRSKDGFKRNEKPNSRDGYKEAKSYERKPRRFDEDAKPAFKKRGGFGEEEKPAFNKRSSFGSDDKPAYKKRTGGFSNDDKPAYKKRSGFGNDDKPAFKKRNDFGDDKPSFKKRGLGGDDKPAYKKRDSFGNDDKPVYKKRGDFGGDEKPAYKKRSGFGDNEKPAYNKRNAFGSDDKPVKRGRGSFSADSNEKSFDKPERNTRGDFGNDKPFGRKRSYNDGDDRPYKRKSYDNKNGGPGYERKPLKRSKFTGKVTEKQEKVDDGTVRLNKYIANAGICSRREADVLIESGAVKVNGKVVTEMGFKVGPDDVVNYGGETLRKERPVYILMNKPKDYITTTEDPRDRRTVMNLVKHNGPERLYPVGRLDRNTTGLLLITNDGELAKKLTHPSSRIRKIYHVYLDKNFKAADIKALQEGFELEDGFIKPDVVEYVDGAEDKKEIGVELHSGRNRIVRRMFEHLGYEVVKLDRVVFAGLTKKDLARGRTRYLSDKEVGMLKML